MYKNVNVDNISFFKIQLHVIIKYSKSCKIYSVDLSILNCSIVPGRGVDIVYLQLPSP